jgi:hypothetical protein
VNAAKNIVILNYLGNNNKKEFAHVKFRCKFFSNVFDPWLVEYEDTEGPLSLKEH